MREIEGGGGGDPASNCISDIQYEAITELPPSFDYTVTNHKLAITGVPLQNLATSPLFVIYRPISFINENGERLLIRYNSLKIHTPWRL